VSTRDQDTIDLIFETDFTHVLLSLIATLRGQLHFIEGGIRYAERDKYGAMILLADAVGRSEFRKLLLLLNRKPTG